MMRAYGYPSFGEFKIYYFNLQKKGKTIKKQKTKASKRVNKNA